MKKMTKDRTRIKPPWGARDGYKFCFERTSRNDWTRGGAPW